MLAFAVECDECLTMMMMMMVMTILRPLHPFPYPSLAPFLSLLPGSTPSFARGFSLHRHETSPESSHPPLRLPHPILHQPRSAPWPEDVRHPTGYQREGYLFRQDRIKVVITTQRCNMARGPSFAGCPLAAIALTGPYVFESREW